MSLWGECVLILSLCGESVLTLPLSGEFILVLSLSGECVMVLSLSGECVLVLSLSGECVLLISLIGERALLKSLGCVRDWALGVGWLVVADVSSFLASRGLDFSDIQNLCFNASNSSRSLLLSSSNEEIRPSIPCSACRCLSRDLTSDSVVFLCFSQYTSLLTSSSEYLAKQNRNIYDINITNYTVIDTCRLSLQFYVIILVD